MTNGKADAMNEVTKMEPQGQVAPVAADPMVSMIERVVMNPDLPVDRITAMIDIRERQLAKEAEQAFNAAFAAAMAEMPDVPRSGENKHLERKYSTLDDLIRTSRPVLARHGLSMNWITGIDGENIRVTAVVRHSAGHSIETTQHGPRDKSGSMNVLQGGGSTETYLKRFTGFAILGLSSGDETDDDGTSHSDTISEEQYRELRDLLDRSNSDEAKFKMAFGARDPDAVPLEAFPAAKFAEAKRMLEEKIKRGQGQ